MLLEKDSESEELRRRERELRQREEEIHKRELLEHYSIKRPVKFYQLDGFSDVVSDSVMHADPDGDTCFSGWAWELRSGSVAVRVQILEGTTRQTALRLLRKLTQTVKKGSPEDCLVEPDRSRDPIPF